MTLKTVKMASTKYYDNLPTTGNAHGRAFRDVEMEKKVRSDPRRRPAWVTLRRPCCDPSFLALPPGA